MRRSAGSTRRAPSCASSSWAAGRGRGDCSAMPALGGDPLEPGPRRTYRHLLAEGTPPKVAITVRRRTPVTEPGVTPPGLRPGGREGEPQARRCRSRVSVPSSASGPVRRSAGSTRRAPSCASSSWAAGRGPGGCSAMPVLGGDPLEPDLGGRIASFSPRHRSLNPNVTPPGLRPGGRKGEPQARRCRSRVSVPSSASGPVRRSAGSTRRAPSCASSSWAAGRGRGGCSAMPALGGDPLEPGPRRTYRQLLAETPVTEPRRYSPPVYDRGAGRASRRRGDAVPASAFPRRPLGRCAGRPARPVGRRHAQARRAGQRLVNRTAPGRPTGPRAAAWQRRREACRSPAHAGVSNDPRQRAPWSAVDRLWQLRLTRRPPWPRAAAPPADGRVEGCAQSSSRLTHGYSLERAAPLECGGRDHVDLLIVSGEAAPESRSCVSAAMMADTRAPWGDPIGAAKMRRRAASRRQSLTRRCRVRS